MNRSVVDLVGKSGKLRASHWGAPRTDDNPINRKEYLLHVVRRV
jgi:hypothetical protein